MVMQTTGPISMGQAMAEMNLTGQQRMGGTELSRLAGKQPNSQYAFSDWYGKSNGIDIVEGTTQWYNQNWSLALNQNFGRSVCVSNPYRGTPGVQFSPSDYAEGGSNIAVGIFPWQPLNGVYLAGLCRRDNVLNIIALGSLDGMRFTSSLGEDLLLTNDMARTVDQWGNLFTTYVAFSPIGQGGRAYSVNLSGAAVRPQPPVYVPPPPTGPGPGDHGG